MLLLGGILCTNWPDLTEFVVYPHFPAQLLVPKPVESFESLHASLWSCLKGFALFPWFVRFLDSLVVIPSCWTEPFTCLNAVFLFCFVFYVPLVLLKHKIWIRTTFLKSLCYPHCSLNYMKYLFLPFHFKSICAFGPSVFGRQHTVKPWVFYPLYQSRSFDWRI